MLAVQIEEKITAPMVPNMAANNGARIPLTANKKMVKINTVLQKRSVSTEGTVLP